MQCMQANPILLVDSDGFFMFLLRFVDLAVFVHLWSSLYIIWIQNWIQWIHLDRSVPSVPSPNSGPASFQRPIRPPKYQNAPGITRQPWHPKTRKKKIDQHWLTSNPLFLTLPRKENCVFVLKKNDAPLHIRSCHPQTITHHETCPGSGACFPQSGSTNRCLPSSPLEKSLLSNWEHSGLSCSTRHQHLRSKRQSLQIAACASIPFAPVRMACPV